MRVLLYVLKNFPLYIEATFSILVMFLRHEPLRKEVPRIKKKNK